MKKLEPAELTLNFKCTSAVNEFIDISQAVSVLNRRFYRQGINWAVKGFTLHNLTGSLGSFQISKLPTTWVFSNSYVKGYHTWKRMNDEALEEQSTTRPRFLDFKIYADVKHHELGYGANLLPFVLNPDTGASEVYTAGEWMPSKIIIPNTAAGATGGVEEREIVAVGGNYPGAGGSGLNAVSLVEGYANSRRLPEVLDPNTPDNSTDTDGASPENWITATFNEGTQQSQEVLESMSGVNAENNIAPYPFENDGIHGSTMYPGGANQGAAMVLHDQLNVTNTTLSNSVRGRGGAFPCGLIRIRKDATLEHAVLQVHLVAGPHRGYLCQPMEDL